MKRYTRGGGDLGAQRPTPWISKMYGVLGVFSPQRVMSPLLKSPVYAPAVPSIMLDHISDSRSV